MRSLKPSSTWGPTLEEMEDDAAYCEQSAVQMAALEVLGVELGGSATGDCVCRFAIRSARGTEIFHGTGKTRDAAISHAISGLSLSKVEIISVRETRLADKIQFVVAVKKLTGESDQQKQPSGVGRCSMARPEWALIIAALRAVSRGGLLKDDYQARNQRFLRGMSSELLKELLQLVSAETDAHDSSREISEVEAQGAILDCLNRVASAAVLIAESRPQQRRTPGLFDNSAWLFDDKGSLQRSDANSNSWISWSPVSDGDNATVEEIIWSMPAAQQSEIPSIVRLFENPASRCCFRSAIDLKGHDVLHALLGRGLQHQDEAFVLGFTAGTAKDVRWWERKIWKTVLCNVYPKPYRIARCLMPAFDLGVECGRQTGHKKLYQQDLTKLLPLRLSEARQRAGIDMAVVRKFFRLEQQQLPGTFASMRLLWQS